jgi:hypothetical protein
VDGNVGTVNCAGVAIHYPTSSSMQRLVEKSKKPRGDILKKEETAKATFTA